MIDTRGEYVPIAGSLAANVRLLDVQIRRCIQEEGSYHGMISAQELRVPASATRA